MVKTPDEIRLWKPGELRVLVVDDEPDVLLGLRLLAESLKAEVHTASSAEAALEQLERSAPHVIVSDITMPGKSGLDLLHEVKTKVRDIQVILITGFGTIEMAVTALQEGAAHFITKPFDNQEVLTAIRRYGQEALVSEQVRQLREDQEGGDGSPFIADDPATAEMLDLVHRVAPTPTTVLIEGESGTGKERVAREIHDWSLNKDRPFLAINTAALPDTLLGAELFGHKKGAFTGAHSDRRGIFEQASGGTVFLDEIGLMSMAFQDQLLRVIQERTVIPLGTSTPVAVDFRLVAATSRNLRARIKEGQFHEDLYYRLHVVRIDVPPLRERPSDIITLATHFLTRYARQLFPDQVEPPRLSDDAIDELQRHTWPGNVRELENCIQRGLILSRQSTIQARHLGLHEDGDPANRFDPTLSYDEGKQRAVQSFQRRYLEDALERSGGNVTQAAAQCGMTRAAFQRIMRTLNMDRGSFRKP